MRIVFAVALASGAAAALVPSPPARADESKPKPPVIEVPYVPTHQVVVEAMLKLADVKEGDVVYDLGCGDGRIVITAVKDFKAKRGVGIDFNPKRLKDCAASVAAADFPVEKAASIRLGYEERQLNSVAYERDGKQVLTFRQGDVLKMEPQDFKDVDVVTLYLLPEVNRKLKPVLLKGLKPGARVVSHDFDMGDDWKEDKRISVKSERSYPHTVFLWTITKQ